MSDLSTDYLGLELNNPLVASSSPLTMDLDQLKQMEDAGASAVVLQSLFEEQIILESAELDRNLWTATDVSAEAQSFFPDFKTYHLSPDEYLEYIHKARKAVKIPVIASLNGATPGGWIRYAKEMEQAGADALELNLYFVPANTQVSGSDVEKRYVDLSRRVTDSVKIPVTVKIGPFFSSVGNIAAQLVENGARGLTLFNRFYQPDFNLETLTVEAHLELSHASELGLRLHWAAVLFDKVKADIAITGGIHSVEDVVKSMMAGGRVAMLTSVLLERGVHYLGELKWGLSSWMEKNEYESIDKMQGCLSKSRVPNPAVFERGNYMKTLSSYSQDSKAA